MPLKQSDLDILLQEGEGAMLEYKESLSASLAREFVAFANTAGGKILLGVRDDGSIRGIQDSNETRARIQDIARNCDPPVKILLERIGNVTAVIVRESDDKPVQCGDGFFWRQGAVTQKLSREELRALFQQTGAIRFDLGVCPKFRYPADFDRQKFDAWLRKSKISAANAIEDVLVNIEAAERSAGKLLFRNAGVLFFAREPRRFFNQAYVTCLLFKGTGKAHILDRKDFGDGIVSDIEDTLRFIERNTRTAYRIQTLQREEIQEYPVPALREAITNAVMHRDWFIEGANVFVEIFSDRIEISNPGGLPPGMSPEDLGHKSVRRNPLIADLLHRIAFIEKAGTGVNRMRDEALRNGYPEPRFSISAFFSSTFTPVTSPTGQIVLPDGVIIETPNRVHDEENWGYDLVKEAYDHDKEAHDRDKKAHDRDKKAHDEQNGVHDRDTTILSAAERQLLILCTQPQNSNNLLEQMGYRIRTGNYKTALSRMVTLGFLEMSIPDKPRSKNQLYRITEAGLSALEHPPVKPKRGRKKRA